MAVTRDTTPGAARRAGDEAPTAPAAPTIFISYSHTLPTTDIAARLRKKLLAPADVWHAEIFLDEQALNPSDLLDASIFTVLERTTHFIVLLTSDYWDSTYCRQEVGRAIERFENKEPIRLLFVLAEELDPNHYVLDRDRQMGRIKSDDPLVRRLGDVVFLGPFNDQGRLVRLQWENLAVLTDQLAQLVKRLERVIE